MFRHRWIGMKPWLNIPPPRGPLHRPAFPGAVLHMPDKPEITPPAEFADIHGDVRDIFLRFAESSNDVFWITQFNPERQIYVNPAVERVWGIPRGRFYEGSRVWGDLVHKDDEAAVISAYERWIRGEPDCEFDMTFRIVLPNAQLRWVHDRGIWVVREKDGRGLVAGIATDVTESRLLEQALQNRERHLRKLLEDRERISQDLHDDVLQSLYAVGLELETLRRITISTPEQVMGRLQEATGRLNRVISEIRSFLPGMSSGLLPGSSFTKALEDLAASMDTSRPGIITLDIDENACSMLTTEQQVDLLNIIKEAVSNSLRHAAAGNISVAARRASDQLQVSIRDDGRGFDPASAAGKGLGIQNMKARAVRAGARFNLSPSAGGTEILIYLPL